MKLKTFQANNSTRWQDNLCVMKTAAFVESFLDSKNDVVIDIKSSWSSNSFTPL